MPSTEAIIQAGDAGGLKALIDQDPQFSTEEGLTETLNYLVLAAHHVASRVEMAQVLIRAGAQLIGPLTAAGGVDNVAVAEALLDAGAPIDGEGRWSPLEEALYFGQFGMVAMLVKRDAPVHNLRIAAGLGRVDCLEGFFTPGGELKPEAGDIAWPFGALPEDQQARSSQDLIDHGLAYAGMHGHQQAVAWLLEHGARINALAPGFEHRGGVLHWAAIRGKESVVKYLVAQGADVGLRDGTLNLLASDWAAHEGHEAVAGFLQQQAAGT